MRRALLLAAALLVTTALAAGQPSQPGARIVTDMVGREVRVPPTITKVYCTSPAGTVLVYVLAPDALAGWNYPLTAAEQAYIPEPYRSLPVLGGWFSTGVTGNVEEIVRARPHVILSMGTTDTLSVSQSERLQEQSGIPVLMMTGHLGHLDAAFEFAGQLLDRRERAAELAAYCRQTLAEARAAAATAAEGRRVRVYYAQGPRGLETDPAGSYHTEILDLLGGVNVAGVAPGSRKGRVTVSPEQILAWDPDLIIAGYDSGKQPSLRLERLAGDPVWGRLKAVRRGRMVVTPQLPFNWFDRPPSVNRLIGVRWVGRLLYPESYPGDLARQVRDFYQLFYRVSLTDEQVAGLLQHALPAGGVRQ